MEPTMKILKVTSVLAVLALAVPIMSATPGQAQGYGWNQGGWRGGGGWGRTDGFIPGAIAGAVVSGAIASQHGYPGYYGNYGYYAGTPYYGGPYDDGGEVVEAAPGGGDADYCAQTYKSYDPRSGTYLGYDGRRHACP
jgi:hypothetical protein